MLILRVIAYVLAGLGVVGTLLPFLPYDDYWIRMWDYPRAQLAFVLLAALVLLGITLYSAGYTLLSLTVVGLCALSSVYQVSRILPYTPLWAKQVADVSEASAPGRDAGLHLLMSNVLQDNEAHDRLLELVETEQPDVLLTLETNQTWQDALDEGLASDYRFTVKVPLENRYGMHLYSKLPIRNERVMHLIADSIPSIYAQVELKDGTWVEVYAVHPPPPSPTEESTSTGRDAELAIVGRRVTERGNANTIVFGDLNDVAWSRSTRLFQRLSGLLDPRRGRGLFASYNANYWFARWPLDHVFHAEQFQVVDLRRLPAIGSDHFPISVKLRHVPNPVEPVKAPQREEDDEEEADETIRTAKQGEVDGLLIED